MSASMVEVLRRWLSGGGVFWGLWGACSLVALYPIWSVTYLPFVDLGGHVEMMDIAAHLGDPVYAARFELRGYWGPNTITLLCAALLGDWVEALTLSRVMLSWYVVGLPLSFGYFCGAFGRSRWLGFFAFPLTWSHALNFGFLNFLVGLPLLFGVIGALRRGLGGERGRLVWGAVGLFVLYFCHFLVWLMAVGYALYVFALFGSRRDWGARLWWVVSPSLVFGGLWVVQQRTQSLSVDPGWSASTATRFKSLEGMLLDLHYAGLSFVQRSVDEVAVIVLLLASLWLLIWRESPREGGGVRAQVVDVAVELSVLVGFGCYFLLPENFGGVNVVAARMIPVLFLLCAASHRLRVGDVRPALALCAVVCVSLWYPFALAKQFKRFEREVIAGLPGALGALPRHALLRFHDDTCKDWSNNNPVIELCVNFHIPRAIHSHLNGGLTSLSFAGAPTSMIAWREGQAIPSPSTERPEGESVYVLLRTDAPPEEYLALPYVTQLYVDAGWWLFQLDPPAQR